MTKAETNIKTSRILAKIWDGVRPSRGLFWVSYVLSLVSQVVPVLIPIYYKKFFDIIGQDGEKSLIIASLLSIIAIVAFLHLVNWVFWWSGTYLNAFVSSTVMARLRQNSFNYLMNHSYSFFSNNFTGSLVQRINRFARAFEQLNDSVMYQLIPLIVIIIGSITVTWFIAPIVSILIASYVLVYAVFNFLFSRWKLKYDLAVAAADSKTTGFLSDGVTNNNAISLFNGFDFESTNFKKVSDDQAKKQITSWYLADAVNIVQGLLIIVVEFFIFYFTLKYWQAGIATIGTFVLAQTYIISLSNQLWGLSRIIRMIYQGIADAKEMAEILDTPYEIKDIPGAQELKVPKGEIAFKNVGFNFNETREVLNSLNVTIKAGEKVAIIGPSGAGKTTFVRLIMRLYDLTKGKIEIDGQDINSVTQDSLRHNISLVPQDPVLFHRTLLENIRYGRRDATDDEVKEAARLAHCDEFIENLSLKYDTFVGERGIKLSGGERQRVAIARAILKHAPILILDEATSSLDSHSEMLIQSALDNLMKGCTTIVIAHRLSTIRKMDRIIAMKDGQIVEEGTHDELANKENGLYKKLWDLQAGGFVGGE